MYHGHILWRHVCSKAVPSTLHQRQHETYHVRPKINHPLDLPYCLFSPHLRNPPTMLALRLRHPYEVTCVVAHVYPVSELCILQNYYPNIPLPQCLHCHLQTPRPALSGYSVTRFVSHSPCPVPSIRVRSVLLFDTPAYPVHFVPVPALPRPSLSVILPSASPLSLSDFLPSDPNPLTPHPYVSPPGFPP